MLPPTAVHELHVIFTDGDSEAERELARTGLTHLKQWGIRPFDPDSAAGAICEQFVRGLLQQRLQPYRPCQAPPKAHVETRCEPLEQPESDTAELLLPPGMVSAADVLGAS